MRSWLVKRPSLVLAAAALGIAVSAGAGHRVGHTDVFATVPSPGAPEGIAVRDGVVYVGTHVWIGGNSGGPPSKIFRYDLATGAPLGDIAIQGQNLGATHGILGMAFDALGRLYVIDVSPSRIIRIDLESEAQDTYATLPDLHPCTGSPPPCAPTILDAPPFPNDLVFDEAGNAYVTEAQAATIFRVPPGGPAEIWFQERRLDSLFGPNGIAIGPDGGLYFAMTASTQLLSPLQGIIYRLPIDAAPPRARDLIEVFRWLEPAAGPDNIAFGASGRLYVALAGLNQVSVLRPSGRRFKEVARFPGSPVENLLQAIPYDAPAGIAFDGAGNVLVTNHTYFTNLSIRWAVLRAWVNDTAAPLIEPPLP